MRQLELPAGLRGLAALAVIGISLAACGGDAEPTALSATLTGANEVPPVQTTATGTATITYGEDNRSLVWNVTYAGLSGPPTGAHFHGPAGTGATAGVVISLGDNLATPIVGTATLTPDQATQLLGGQWYVNIHTEANPGGEIRGQVMR